MSENTIDYLTYKRILQERLLFRQAAGVSSSELNYYDAPLYQNFKILFHFYNSVEDISGNEMMGTGFLHPTWSMPGAKNLVESKGFDKFDDSVFWVQQGHKTRADELYWWRHNTAFSYLIENDELERAGYLRKFIELLSTINSESPWYFQRIKGLDDAIKRQQVGGDFVFKDRNKITIECLADSVDYRISTLLDLYRSIVYSWEHKKEILPSNLRKFDMSIVLFQLPISKIHVPQSIKLSKVVGMAPELVGDDDGFSTLYKNGSRTASYKIYEFHNCEFDYASSVAAAENVTNDEIKETNYNIGIYYDDMYEIRFNEFMANGSKTFEIFNGVYSPVSEITDILQRRIWSRAAHDISIAVDNFGDQDDDAEYTQVLGASEEQIEQLNSELKATLGFLGSKGGSGNLLNELTNAKTYINKYAMGNIFNYSVKNVSNALDSLLRGDLVNTIGYFTEDLRNYNGLVSTKDHPLGNLNGSQTAASSEETNTQQTAFATFGDQLKASLSNVIGRLDNMFGISDFLHAASDKIHGRSLNDDNDLPEESYMYSEQLGNIMNPSNLFSNVKLPWKKDKE